MIKIKVFKKNFYMDSYFFVVGENDEEFFGFDLGWFVWSEIKWESCFKNVMHRVFDEKIMSDVPESIRCVVDGYISDSFFEIDFLKRFTKYGVRLLR